MFCYGYLNLSMTKQQLDPNKTAYYNVTDSWYENIYMYFLLVPRKGIEKLNCTKTTILQTLSKFASFCISVISDLPR